MNRRSILSIAMAAGILLSVSAVDLRAAGPGIFRPLSRPRAQTTTRTYRSYSVTPENAEVQEGAVVTPNSGLGYQPAPSRSGRITQREFGL